MKTVRVKIVLSLQMEDGVECGVSANTDQGELEILVPLICPRYLHTPGGRSSLGMTGAILLQTRADKD